MLAVAGEDFPFVPPVVERGNPLVQFPIGGIGIIGIVTAEAFVGFPTNENGAGVEEVGLADFVQPIRVNAGVFAVDLLGENHPAAIVDIFVAGESRPHRIGTGFETFLEFGIKTGQYVFILGQHVNPPTATEGDSQIEIASRADIFRIAIVADDATPDRLYPVPQRRIAGIVHHQNFHLLVPLPLRQDAGKTFE